MTERVSSTFPRVYVLRCDAALACAARARHASQAHTHHTPPAPQCDGCGWFTHVTATVPSATQPRRMLCGVCRAEATTTPPLPDPTSPELSPAARPPYHLPPTGPIAAAARAKVLADAGHVERVHARHVAHALRQLQPRPISPAPTAATSPRPFPPPNGTPRPSPPWRVRFHGWVPPLRPH